MFGVVKVIGKLLAGISVILWPPSKPIIRMNTAASELMSAVMVYWVFFSIGEEKEATQSVVIALTSSV